MRVVLTNAGRKSWRDILEIPPAKLVPGDSRQAGRAASLHCKLPVLAIAMTSDVLLTNHCFD
jgi:hypothetical protein